MGRRNIFIAFIHIKENHFIFLSHFMQKTEINPTLMRRRYLSVVIYSIHKHTRSPQGLYNWAACDVTNPILSPLLSLTFQVISGTPQIFRLLNPRGKKRYYATQYVNFSVTLLRYGLKILTDSWIEGDSLGFPDHPPRRCHPECQPTFIHFFTNTLKCLHGRLSG